MTGMTETDVVIIGGGPAGASTALSLLTYSNLRVIVVESSDLTSQRVGEHVSAAIFPLLSYLKIDREDLAPHTFIASHSHSALWGSPAQVNRDNIFTTEIESYHLDRSVFELQLLEAISERGGLVFPRTKCKGCRFDGSRWSVALRHAERGSLQLKARFLVDATGRNASIGRMIGAKITKKDKLIGVGMYMSMPETVSGKQSIEATENGWWYHASLPDGIATAVFFSDADLISKNKWHLTENWLRELEKTVATKSHFKACRFLSRDPWAKSAASQIADSKSFSRFLAVGDSAAAFDPISSMGVGFALSSGCSAANAIQSDLSTGTETASKQFRSDIRKTFSQFELTQKYYYASEKRWLHAPFWSRRNI
jgi:flavin-dependent dehydrogenase